jgi:hypothetical protein
LIEPLLRRAGDALRAAASRNLEIAEADLNPVRCMASGCVVLASRPSATPISSSRTPATREIVTACQRKAQIDGLRVAEAVLALLELVA